MYQVLKEKKDIPQRLLWMDALRGLLIVSVVVGHSTGLFNGYIYQFHMGAFFFVSGYLSHQDEKTMTYTVYHGFFTLFLPIFSSLVGLLLVTKFLQVNNVYSVFFPDHLAYIGIKATMKEFFFNGVFYVWWLGAAWFILVLLGVRILSGFIFHICGKKYNILYAGIIFALFLVGYWAAGNGGHRWNWDLILIAELYFGIGAFTQKYNLLERLPNKNSVYLVGVFLTFLLMFFIKVQLGLRMDFPSRELNFPLLDLAAVLNGVLFLFFFSKLLVKIPYVYKGFQYLGQKTLPIVLFHFIWFNLAFFLLYLFGVVPFSYLQNFVPTSEIGQKYWLLISCIGIGGSVLSWKLLMKVRFARILFGQEKELYKKYYNIAQNLIERQCEKREARKGNTIHNGNALKEKSKALVNIIKEKKVIMVLLIFFLILVLFPLYREGIICNDELQSRYWSYRGFVDFYKHYFQIELNNGRALSAPIDAFTWYLGCIGQSNWTYKILQILSILLDITLFGVLLNKLFSNTAFSVFCGVSLLAFLPVTFEHTVPNAFVALYNFPLALLLWSLILYWDWLENRKTEKILVAMFSFFVVACSYEAFIVFFPVYVLLTLYKYGWKKMLSQWKAILWPFFTSSLYLIAYLVARKMFPTQYMGNSIVIPHIKDALKIIVTLVYSSFPGYYLTSPKYHYLFQIHAQVTSDDLIRALLAVIAFGGLTYLLLKDANMQKKKMKSGWIVFCLFGIVALPMLPIAMAAMYQNNVGENGFMALPVTFFGYFPAVLICCFVIWRFSTYAQSKKSLIVVTICSMCLLLPVQIMNGEFAQQNQRNFQRLETMEELVKSEVMQNVENVEFYSEDMFQTRNALFIGGDYWSNYAQASGLNIDILQGQATSEENRIYYDDTNFYIWVEDQLCILSKSGFPNAMAIPYVKKPLSFSNGCFNSKDRSVECSILFLQRR